MEKTDVDSVGAKAVDSYQPTIYEIVAKSFIYFVLSVAGLIGSLGLAIFLWGGRSTKGEGQKIIAAILWDVINTPYFVLFTIAVVSIAVYSSLKGMPVWVKYFIYAFLTIVLAPVAIPLWIKIIFEASNLDERLGWGVKPYPKGYVSPKERMRRINEKYKEESAT